MNLNYLTKGGIIMSNLLLALVFMPLPLMKHNDTLTVVAN